MPRSDAEGFPTPTEWSDAPHVSALRAVENGEGDGENWSEEGGEEGEEKMLRQLDCPTQRVFLQNRRVTTALCNMKISAVRIQKKNGFADLTESARVSWTSLTKICICLLWFGGNMLETT